MRVFLCEFVTGGGLAGEAALPCSLAREGAMMLRALADDLTALPDTQLITSRDCRLADLAVAGETVPIGPADDPWAVWRRLIADCEALWPVAPETGGALERLTLLAEAAGRPVLGCDTAAVRLAASKRATAERLAPAGLPVAPCWTPDNVPAASGPWVVKPDDGAGAVDTRLVDDEAVPAALRGRTDIVVQPYVAGTPASLTLLCRGGESWLLTVNRQHVTIEQGRFRFAGVTVGWAETAPLASLADAVAAALPGLWGLVGVDFVATPDGPVVIEVNPRVTTAYAGLGASIGDNPAALVLALLSHPVAELRRPLPRRPVDVRVA